MLVLSRKSSESIYIGEDVTITVVEIKGNRVKLGIEAPPQVDIVREEIRQRRQQSAPRRAQIEVELPVLSLAGQPSDPVLDPCSAAY